MARWIYCYNNEQLPPDNVPVVVIFRVRRGERIFGVQSLAMVQRDIFTQKPYWIEIKGVGDKCQPYGWLDTGGEEMDEVFLNKLLTVRTVEI